VKAATKTNLKLVSLVLGMFCFGFALVPIYDVFCEITENSKYKELNME
jgi:cytochrome c oxidase assembly protein subunit 11